MEVVLNDSYIDSQISILQKIGFDNVFNSENEDIMIEFIYQN